MAKRGKARSKKRGWRPGSLLFGLALGHVLALWVYPEVQRFWSEPPVSMAANDSPASTVLSFYDNLERGEEVVDETRAAQGPVPVEPVAADAAGQPTETLAQPPADAEQPATDSAGQSAESAAAPREPAPQRPPPRPVDSPGLYVLQLGAFTRQQAADSLKARLALAGINARVQAVRINQQTYYRVRIGPTENLQQLNADRARLREHRFDSTLLKLVE